MMNYKMITCGLLGDRLCDYIQQNHADLITCRYIEKLDQKDLEGVNALAGFYQFDGLDLSGIQWIHSFGAGVDDYTRHPDINQSITLTRTLGYMDKRIGEYCLTYILAELKSVIPVFQNQQAGKWERRNLNVLYDKKVLVFGTGLVGGGIASVLSGLAESIVGVNYSGSLTAGFDRVVPFRELDTMDTQEFDIIINALPLTRNTHYFFDSSLFSRFTNVLLINVGRGQSLREADLLEAIKNGHVSRAILDVFEQEPVPKGSPLWTHPRITLTPHHAGLTTFRDLKKSFEDCVTALKSGQRNHLFVDLNKGY